MRKFLSNFLLSIFVIVFAFPVSTFAQFSWTPPAGPPVGNNTPSPVNVGPFEQWKAGPLKVGPNNPFSSTDTTLSAAGSVIFQPTQSIFGGIPPGAQSFASFLPSASFTGSNRFQVGTSDGTGGSPEILFNGRLKYIPRNPNGSPIAGQQPQTGYVLRAIDSTGLVGWGPAGGTTVPDGNNQGDILIWDASTNSWITGPNNPGGPVCEAGAVCDFGDGVEMPPGNPGDTMWYDGSIAPNGEWVTTDQIYHERDIEVFIGDDPTPISVSKTTLTNDLVDIWAPQGTRVGNLNSGFIWLQSPEVKLPIGDANPQGKVITATDAEGTLAWVNPSDLGLEGGAGGCALPATTGQTCWYDGTGWQATDKIKHDTVQTTSGTGQIVNIGRTQLNEPIVSLNATERVNVGSGAQGTTYLNSPTVIFENQAVSQNVRFNSSSVQFRGSSQEPGIGRIPFSTDANGTFKWNQNLTYTTSTLSLPPFGSYGLGKLLLKNPTNIPGVPGSIAVFQNEGITLLQDDVTVDGNLRVSSTGRLYLNELDYPNASNTLMTLCVDTQTRKVMYCQPMGVIGTPIDTPSTNTDIWYAGTGQSFTFPMSGTANVKLCGSGGGGGGGGRGWQVNPNIIPGGHGGGGGGGGEKGECRVQTISVTAGQTIQMNIPAGGEYGRGSWGVANNPPSQSSSSDQSPTDGGNGGQTVVTFSGSTFTAQGGRGGKRGYDASSGNGQGRGGLGGNTSLNNPATSSGYGPTFGGWWSWHTGANGNLDSSSGVGGRGGDGEHASANVNNLSAIPVNLLSGNSSSAGGRGGYWTDSQITTRYGGSGSDGAPGYGGGGGGGAYGATAQGANRGGNGGRGGSGYVQITYPSPSGGTPQSNEVQFTFNSQYDLRDLPAAALASGQLTIKIWGGGGGGGSVSNIANNAPSQNGGGGGSGAYKEIVWPIPSTLITYLTNNPSNPVNLNIEIGQGGGLGISPNGVSDPGGQTRVSISTSAGGPNINQDPLQGLNGTRACAFGGLGGSVGNPIGSGGAGGSDNCTNAIGGTQGNAGTSGNSGGFGGIPVNNGFGGGGRGSVMQNVGGFSTPVPGSPGQPGAVRISW